MVSLVCVTGCALPAKEFDRVANNAECCGGTDMGATSTCVALGFQGGSLACSPLCTYDVSGCTLPLGAGRNPVAVVTGDHVPVQFSLEGICPAAAYLLEYDPGRVTIWDAPTEGTQILPNTRYSPYSCSTSFYAQAVSASTALNDVPVTLRVDLWTGRLELVDEVALTCVAIDISPSVGPVGTPLTVSLTPAIAPLAFDRATHAEWRGHFQPIVGSPSDEIAIVYGADRFFESSPGTATVFIGDGRLVTAMPALSLLVGSYGALVGTATVNVHGLELRRAFTFVPYAPRSRARELIDDPNDFTIPRQYGDVLTYVEIVPILEPMFPHDLEGNHGNQFALELCVSDAGQPSTSWPSTLTVTLAAVDAAGAVIDSVPGVTLDEASSADWPGCHVYRTAVDAPIIAVDSTVDKQLFPSVTILVAGHESHIAILPGGPQVKRRAVPAQEFDRTATCLEVVEHGHNISARVKAMRESLEAGTASERSELVAALLRMSQGTDQTSLQGLPEQEARQRWGDRTLLQEFLSTAPQRFASDPDAKRGLVQLAEVVLANDGRLEAYDLRPDAFDAMVANCASTEEMRAKVMDCVVRDHEWSWYHVEGRLRKNGQLDEDLIARVRPIVRGSLERDAVNRTALRLASECGDAAILPDLQEAISRGRLSPDDLYTARQAVWKTEIQNPPRRLIEFLENARQDHWAIWNHDGTAWIVRKAVERGLPREDIQRAARQYYANCEPETLRRMRVLGLDRELIDLGILKEADLPDRDWLNMRRLGW